MAVVGDVFGLNSVYAKQVENVENSNFASWPEDIRYGYYVGGEQWGPPPPNITHSRTDRIDFSNETVTVSHNRTTAIKHAKGISSNSDAYLLGGIHPTNANGTNLITRIDLSSETDSLPGNNLADQIYNGGVISNIDGTRGYYAGGYGPVVNGEDEIKSFDISTESITVLSGTLSQALTTPSSNIRSEEYGYFASGNELPNFDVTNVNRLDLSNETVKNLPGIINPAKKDAAGTSSLQYGYLLGGQRRNPAPPPAVIYTPSTERLDFNTETFNTLPSAAQPPLNKRLIDACTNSSFGYIGGGWAPGNGPYVQYSQISRLDFSNDIVSQPGNDLSVNRSTVATVQGGQSYRAFTTKSYGYYFGGDKFLAPPPPQVVSTILRMDFSTGSYSDLGNSMPAQKTNVNTVASNERSYGKWTNTQVIRFDFANESNSLFTISNTPVSSGGKGNASNSNYGYWLNLSRIDYSNESVSTPITQSQNFTSGKNSNISTSTLSTKYAYFAGGGNSSSNVHSAIHKLDFSNEVITKIDPILSANKYNHTAITGVGYGYYGGGYYYPPPGRTNTIDKLDFSTEVVSPMPSLTVYADNRGALSDDYYGYISGGFGPGPTNHSRVERIDFSNSTYTVTTNLPIARDKHSGVTNSLSSS